MTSAIVTYELDDIHFDLDRAELLKQTRLKARSELAEELWPLAEDGARRARPKALYLVAYVSDRGDDFVDVEGTRFTSRILRVNLDKAHRVFPHLATCGMELQEWAAHIEDPLHRYWAEMVKQLALTTATKALTAHITATYAPGDTSAMNPGSLPDWPIEQQRALFSLFGAGAQRIGVQLSESLLMVPTKSVSGIRFPTTEHFESCQLCPRENCPGRRAPFEPTLSGAKYSASPGHEDTAFSQ